MAKNQTQKSKYPSRYSDGYVTPVQYIIELICEKKAGAEKKDLPSQFWKLPEWQTFFKSQLRKCHSLLRKYDEQAIIQALKNKRARSIWSLFAPWLEDIIEEEQAILNTKKKLQDDDKVVKINRQTMKNKPREYRVENNLLSKLMSMDDEQE